MPELIHIGEKYIAVTGIPETARNLKVSSWMREGEYFETLFWTDGDYFNRTTGSKTLPEIGWRILGRLNELENQLPFDVELEIAAIPEKDVPNDLFRNLLILSKE